MLQREAILRGRGNDTLSGEVTLSKLFCLPSANGCTIKEKSLLPDAEFYSF